MLNARGHRLDDHHPARITSWRFGLCSTPEGIGSTITPTSAAASRHMAACSTPEGIGSTITWTVLDAVQLGEKCSTPEGIGSTITRP